MEQPVAHAECGSAKFLIFYVVQGDTLRVIRVLHGKRDVGRILKQESADDDTLN